MSRSALVMLGMTIGSVVGSYLPVLFGAGLLSFTSIIASAIGGFLGIWLVYKMTA